MAAALPFLLAVALGANAQLDLGLRTEVRSHRTDPPPAPTEERGIDLSASPHLLLRLSGGGNFLQATYTPRFTARDVDSHTLYENMHEGELRLHLAPDPTWNLEVFAGGAAGRTDLVTESQVTSGGSTGGGTGTGAGPSVGTSATNITATQAIDIQRLRAGLSLRVAPDRIDEILLSGLGSVDGGANARSRAVFRVAHVLDGAAEYRHAVTRLDQLGLRLSAEWGRIPSLDTTSASSTGLLLWRHRLSPEVETWGGAGAVYLYSVPAVGSTLREIRPAGELGILRVPSPRPPASGDAGGTTAAPQPPTRLTLRDYSADAVAHLGAAMDRNTGLTSPQLDATASVNVPIVDRLGLLLGGTLVVTWPERGGTRTETMNAGATYTLATRFILDVGAYGTWQHSDDPTVPSFSEYGVFLGLTFDAPPARF